MHKFLQICAFACLIDGVVCTAGAAAKSAAEVPSGAAPNVPAETAADFTPVLGKEWKLASVTKGNADSGFSRDAVGDSGFYTLHFDAAALKMNGKAAPNSYSADYKQNGSDVSFGQIVATLMFAFNEPETLREHEYFAYLQGVNRWALTGDGLELYGPDAVVLRFVTE